MFRSLFSDRSIAGAVPWVVSSRIVAALLGFASTTVLAGERPIVNVAPVTRCTRCSAAPC